MLGVLREERGIGKLPVALGLFKKVDFASSAKGKLTFRSGAAVILPDIVDSVKKSVSAQSRASAGGAVDIVVLHGDLIVFTDHLEGPVVVTIATSGEGRFAVDEVI